MKNKKHLFFLVVFFYSTFVYNQNFKTSKTIVDKANKQPLAYVNIYNSKDNSVSNEDGIFVFVSSKNEINFSVLGYNTYATTFDAVAKQDTIFMQSKALELKEVVIVNAVPFMKKVYDKMNENNISNYSVPFFLRSVLKKNDSIFKLQDIYAKRGCYTSPKTKNIIEILNMRKTGFEGKKWNSIGFEFPDFNAFFSLPFLPLDKCNFTDEDYADKDYKKITFEGKIKTDWGQTIKGHFIINRKDYAIVEYFVTIVDIPEIVPYKKTLIGGTQYRTTKLERLLRLSKDENTGKYYLNQSKLDALVEVLTDKHNKNTFFYDLSMDYFTTTTPTNEPVNANFSADKDVFKVKFDYLADFWDNQNQLPLTQELNFFLKRLSVNKDKKNEFEVIGNF